MRKTIQQLAVGRFEYHKPEVSFQTQCVKIVLSGVRDYAGEFTVTGAGHVPMRGLVHTSSWRMECLTPHLEGSHAVVRYQFHSNGLAVGDVVKGEFYFVLNQEEYALPFVVSVVSVCADTSVGKVASLHDFVRLAKEDMREAVRLFYSPNFKNILQREESRIALLYDGLCREPATAQKIEEFLIGCDKKQPVLLTLEKQYAEFVGILASRKEQLELRRSEWGYLDITVESDAAFLVPSKKRLRAEDFMGSVCMFEYYIEAEQLHAGNNYGRLYFRYYGEQVAYEVCATQKDYVRADRLSAHQQKREAHMRLARLYIDYRLNKIVTGVWVGRSVEYLNHLISLDEDNDFYALMKAQAFIINNQRQEAEWIMQEYKRSQPARDVPLWGYYLYLCTLMDRDAIFVEHMTEEIEALFLSHAKSPLLFWILLFLREEYDQKSSMKLRAIEVWTAESYKSPYFYVEAYYIYQKEPYLLGKLGTFEREILNWAAKHGALSQSVAEQVCGLVAGVREFNKDIYRILKACYEVYSHTAMLSAICGYLIKGQCYGPEYRAWYEAGIRAELHMTGLYEAYLMSLSSREVGSVPRMLQMYFQYDSGLPAKQKAVLYVNIIAQREKDPEIYQNYKSSIEQFAMEQILSGHVDDNLAVIYQQIIRSGFLSDELAEGLSKILFTWKLTCSNPAVARALILTPWQKEPKVVSLNDQTAYFQAYTEEFEVILVDNQGNYYAGGIPYQVQQLLHPAGCISRCLELAPLNIDYIFYWLLSKRNNLEFVMTDRQTVMRFLAADATGERFRAELLFQMILLCHTHGIVRDMKQYMEMLDFSQISAVNRRKAIAIAKECGKDELAYRMVREYGYDFMPLPVLESICIFAITEADYEEDDFLTDFAACLFAAGSKNETLLIYLSRYYQGATHTMAAVWKAAEEQLLDTFDLEERILTQFLYTTDYTVYAEEIFDSYCSRGQNEMVAMAYLTWFSNQYLIWDAVIPAHVMTRIYEAVSQGKQLNDTCRLGLLKHFSEKPPETERQAQVLAQLFSTFAIQGMYFAFYQKFPVRLLEKYHLHDRDFVEYHTEPARRVRITWRREGGEFLTEEMTEMYDGIFVKDFTLFLGERIQYYITEDDGGREETTESGCLVKKRVKPEALRGRYGVLSLADEAFAHGNYEKLMQQVKKYRRMEEVTSRLFHLQ